LHDLNSILNDFYIDDPTVNPYNDANVISKFFDQHSLIQKFKNSQIPLYLSINVQSLASKHEKLCSFINELQQNQVLIDVIAVQETWQIINPTTVQIPGFNLFFIKLELFQEVVVLAFMLKTLFQPKLLTTYQLSMKIFLNQLHLKFLVITKKFFSQTSTDIPHLI